MILLIRKDKRFTAKICYLGNNKMVISYLHKGHKMKSDADFL